MRLRSHLLLIAAITVVPIIVMVSVGVVFLFKRMRDDQLQALLATARVLSLALDRSFQEGMATLTALSASKHLERGDLKPFHEEARRVLAAEGHAASIVLVDPLGQQIVHTGAAFGAPLPRGRGTIAPKIAQTRKPMVSNLLTGPMTGKHLVVIGVPVLMKGQVQYILTMALPSAYLQQVLELQSIPKDYLCTVMDGNKIIVARSRDIDEHLGRPASESLSVNSASAIEGTWIGEPLEFEPVYAAHRRSEFSGWTVALGIPVSKINRPLIAFLGTVTAGIIILLFIVAALVMFFGRRVVASVTALSEGAQALGSGRIPQLAPSPVSELDEVRRELEAAASKRTLMETVLRQSEERLRTIIETEPECVKVVAPDGALLEMNAAGLQMIEADSLEAVRGMKIFDFVAPECRAAVLALSQKISQGESGKLEFELIGLKGKRRWIETHAAPLRGPHGEVSALLAVSRDITEHKRAEDALRASEERLKLALSASRMGVWEWDFETATVFWSPECREIVGRELANESFESFARLLHSDDAGLMVERVHEAIDNGTVYSAEFRLSGYEPARWFANYGRAEYDAEGKAVRMIGTIQEITERKQLLAQLEQRAAQLAEADRRKDEFLALLAHELRNPLAPVTNGIEILRVNGLPTAESRHAADLIDEQMQHMARLIDDLLDVSRLTRGSLVLRKEELQLAEIVKSALEKNRHIISESGVEVIVDLPREPLRLDADRIRLIQVLANLINNAAKYTEPGGSITVRAERHGTEALISITDTGIGIPADKLEQIFELFVQLDDPQERTRGGLGLGLTLARRLVELHGGTLDAKSEGLEKGSEFVIRLPALPEQPAETAAGTRDRPDARIALDALKILVVDDNRAAADMLGTLFRLKKNPVQLAYDGEQAVKAAEAFQPDVVLLDLGMPKLNGYDTCRLMRERPWGQRMIIIALTGWGREEDRERTRQAGFDYHLVKPIRPLNLMDVIADLARKKLRSEQ